MSWTADALEVEANLPVAPAANVDEQDKAIFGPIRTIFKRDMGFASALAWSALLVYLALTVLAIGKWWPRVSTVSETALLSCFVYGNLVHVRLDGELWQTNHDNARIERRRAILRLEDEAERKKQIELKKRDYHNVRMKCWTMAMGDLREMA